MSRNMRTYFYAVLGGIGGLVGWQVSNILGLSFGPSLYVSEMLVGALVGLCVGLFIGITEGALTLNIVQAAKSGFFSGLLGLVAGAIGLPVSEFLFQTMGAGYFGRAIGWGLFGMLIGLAEAAFGKNQIWKGMLGGFIGGAIGGVLLEGGLPLLPESTHRQSLRPRSARRFGRCLHLPHRSDTRALLA